MGFMFLYIALFMMVVYFSYGFSSYYQDKGMYPESIFLIYEKFVGDGARKRSLWILRWTAIVFFLLLFLGSWWSPSSSSYWDFKSVGGRPEKIPKWIAIFSTIAFLSSKNGSRLGELIFIHSFRQLMLVWIVWVVLMISVYKVWS